MHLTPLPFVLFFSLRVVGASRIGVDYLPFCYWLPSLINRLAQTYGDGDMRWQSSPTPERSFSSSLLHLDHHGIMTAHCGSQWWQLRIEILIGVKGISRTATLGMRLGGDYPDPALYCYKMLSFPTWKGFTFEPLYVGGDSRVGCCIIGGENTWKGGPVG